MLIPEPVEVLQALPPYPSLQAMRHVDEVCPHMVIPSFKLPKDALHVMESVENGGYDPIFYKFREARFMMLEASDDEQCVQFVGSPSGSRDDEDLLNESEALLQLSRFGARIGTCLAVRTFGIAECDAEMVWWEHSESAHKARGADGMGYPTRFVHFTMLFHTDPIVGLAATIEAALQGSVVSNERLDGSVVGLQEIERLGYGTEPLEIDPRRAGVLWLRENERLLSVDKVFEISGIDISAIPNAVNRKAFIKFASMQQALEVAWRAMRPEFREVLDYCYAVRGLQAPVTIDPDARVRCVNYYFPPAEVMDRGFAMHEEPRYYKEPSPTEEGDWVNIKAASELAQAPGPSPDHQRDPWGD